MTDVIDDPGMELIEYPHAAPVTLFGTDDPDESLAKAAQIADALSKVLQKAKLTVKIGGNTRPYVLAEGWTCLGSLVGVFPRTVWTRPLENGWEARVDAVTRDGSVVGSAESQCTRAERNWANRDDFALRSMAQTRAMSKALRMPLGFIVVLAGFEATPADEMPVIDTPTSEPAASGVPVLPGQFVLPFGKHKGKTIGEVAATDKAYIGWLAAKYEPKSDHDQELALAAGAFLHDEDIPF